MDFFPRSIVLPVFLNVFYHKKVTSHVIYHLCKDGAKLLSFLGIFFSYHVMATNVTLSPLCGSGKIPLVLEYLLDTLK